MPTFAIVRQDGEVDTAEGASIEDIASRYGWPGNGDIVPYSAAIHDGARRHNFTDPAHQRELLADKPVDSAASPSLDELVAKEVARQLKTAIKASQAGTDPTTVDTKATTKAFKAADTTEGK